MAEEVPQEQTTGWDEVAAWLRAIAWRALIR